MQQLTVLQSLDISKCPDFTGEDEEVEMQSDQHPHMLWKELQRRLFDLPRMVKLPEGIQFLTSLQDITIIDCDNLQILPAWLRTNFQAKWDGRKYTWIRKVSHEHLDKEVENSVSKAGTSSQGASQELSKITASQELTKDEEVVTGASALVIDSSALQDKEVLTEERKDPCFILFLLPEDYEIEKDTLIQLWMATGCIKDEPMELQGDKCFRNVLDAEYLLHCGTNFMTGKDRYRINANKINELLNTVKDDACYYLQWKKEFQNNPMAVESIQHVSLGCTTEIDAATFETLEKFKELRTLLFLANHCHNRVIQMPRHLYSSFSKLEALDLSRTHMKELPSTIGDMSQLRYLDLSWTLVEWLPEILCSLTELQTLKLRECSNLSVLPEQLKELTKLRHLDVDVLGQLEVIPKGIGELVHLRTLPGFLVGTEDGCEIKELGKLNSLSGQLCIANLENVADKYEAKGAALRRKQHLEKLELRWTASEICGTHRNSEAILEELEPSKKLGELEISCYEGESIPGWIEDTDYCKLVSIVLYRCENLSEFPVVDYLPNLKLLELVRMNSVRKIGGNRQDDDDDDDYDVAFPKLEKLEINEMQSLEKWDWKKRNEDDFRSLTHLIIENCPELQEFDVLPHLSSIRYFEIREKWAWKIVPSCNLYQTGNFQIPYKN